MPDYSRLSLSPFCHAAKLMLKTMAIVSLIALVPSLLAQDESAPQDRPKGLITRPKTRPFALNPGDLIEIQVSDTPDMTKKVQLDQNGAIRLDNFGLIVLAGNTTTDAATLIENHLKEKDILPSAHVSVFLDKAAPVEVTVIGEVNHPGTYALTGLPTIQNALATAGGLTPREGSIITITHRNDPQNFETISVSAETPAGHDPFLPLVPWDIVSVSQMGVVYVVGDVGHPGEYYLNNGRSLRVLEVLALAQGLKDYAAPEKATIIRSNGKNVTSTPINLARIQKNLDEDKILEPYDVLVVPHSGLKQFAASALPGLSATAVNAVAIALATR